MIRHLLKNQENLEKTAIIEKDTHIRYLELIGRERALRGRLPHARENIAILLENGADYIAALWGTLAAGMSAFPLNCLMTSHEIAPQLEFARVRTVITSEVFRHIFKELKEFHKLAPNVVYMEELSPDTGRISPARADVSPNETMLLLNTSGTSGKCKIVQLSERNVEASVFGYLDKLRIEEPERDAYRFTLAAPFSSVYGIMILSACLTHSFPIVVLEQPFTLETLYKAAEKHRITHYEGGTSAILLMEQMSGRPITYDISSLTYFGTGGSMVSGSTIEKLHAHYEGKSFFHGYGMTEAAPLITKHPQARVLKTDSVGTPIKGLEIAVETNEGIVRTPRVTGEIVVKGPNVMLGYYDNEAETKKTLKNGYLYTGDVGCLDEEGYLYIRGRKKNVVLVRGFTVYPEEVEECIKNSLLADDCLVYGQPDGAENECLCADIVPALPEVRAEDILAHCGAHLAEYKRPKKISFTDSIRRNISGKAERGKEGSQ